jgi:hypothetical protein
LRKRLVQQGGTVDPVSLVLNALTSGAAQGVADSVSDAIKSAYSKLKQLVSAKLSGNKSVEVALAEHAADPESWQAPLTKALTTCGVGADQPVIEAAQQLMALLDPAGTQQGKYQIDLPAPRVSKLAMGNQQFNTFNMVTPTVMMAPPTAEIRPGQPRNEAAFEAAGGRARLGRALDEAYEDGPGWVHALGGRSSGRCERRTQRDSCAALSGAKLAHTFSQRASGGIGPWAIVRAEGWRECRYRKLYAD